MQTLLFLAPGHFHAALTLRERHPLLNEAIFVYATAGPELDAFLSLVEDFNHRPERPTAWRPTVYAGPDPLERLIAERPGEAVVLAGRNDSKLESIRRLHAAGFAVLADKPWVTGPGDLEALAAATDGAGALLMDIMTTPREIGAILRKKLVETPAVFGEFRRTGAAGAAIELESVHHLCKMVNGRPLVRPPWYFDIRVQGDGLVDIPTHLAHLAQWLAGGPPLQYGRELILRDARRWATEIPLARFRQITGLSGFTPELAPWVKGEALHYLCNGELTWSLRGLPVRLRSEWRMEAPAGGGDTEQAVLRGTRAEVLQEQGPQTDFHPRLLVRPAPGETGVPVALERALAEWEDALPGLGLADAGERGWQVTIPAALRSGHEEHFAQVLDAFLGYLEAGHWPERLASDLRSKYTLLARASQRARQEEAP